MIMEALYVIGYIILAAGVAGVLYTFGKVLWSGFKAVKNNDD
jgi:hypothetical protein